jgi:hypothetical protein
MAIVMYRYYEFSRRRCVCGSMQRTVPEEQDKSQYRDLTAPGALI